MSDTSTSNETRAPVGIGALSTATGVPVSTLRTWERRYGFPQPQRTEGGHRLYAPETVDRLLWVQRALAAGHRPAQVLALSPPELQQLLEPTRIGFTDEVDGQSAEFDVFDGLERWLDAVRHLDERKLHDRFRADWGSLGTVAFIEQRLAPFLVAVGELWSSGEIGVAHEHFASERARDFLVSVWRPLSAAHSSPRVLCATLPGELHVLGLHMAACAVAVAGGHVIFIGSGAPVQDIERVVRDSDVNGVLLSVSRSMPRSDARMHLRALDHGLDRSIGRLVGGGGAPEGTSFAHASSLAAIPDWVQSLSQAN